MIATYAAALAVGVASLVLGQAALALSGARRWSWLAPAVGLALVCAISWATVRIGENGVFPAVLIPLLTVVAAIFLRGRVEGGGEALRVGAPVAIGALLAASLPFAVEGHFGILGTGFNPDMSQHLLATDRLAEGHGSQLLNQGYPLGPHAVVVALNEGLGIGIVQGFGGVTMAAAIVAALTALAAFADGPRRLGAAAALVVGLAYLVASYYAQGDFKEVIEAIFVLAFVLALRESARSWRDLPLRFVPAALIAIGAVYAYSFPGLIWLAAILLVWLALERMLPVRPLLLALVVFLVGTLPELGRMIDFKQFETFDPNGPGLGNLFGQVSPFTALGIWPSGDFRVAAGDGAVPALVYYLGAAFASALLVLGVRRAWRSGERAILAGLAAVIGLYLASRLGGTPYTSAKALEIAAPVLALTILVPLTRGRPRVVLGGYLAAAGLCSLLALANAPVGPTTYSPALTSLRPLLAGGSTLVLAPDELLAEEQGRRYIAWELRGGRVCIEPASAAGGRPPTGVRYFVTIGSPSRPPFSQLRRLRLASPYVVWERQGVVGGPSPCPLIAVRQARQGP
ncbi:MAG TPA: hypothetical protein VIS95_02280 [Solirubrobacterales bacterium]